MEFILSFQHVGPGDGTRIARLGGKLLYPMGPPCWLPDQRFVAVVV